MSIATAIESQAVGNKIINDSSISKVKKYLIVCSDLLAVFSSVVLGYIITLYIRATYLTPNIDISHPSSFENQIHFFILPTAYLIMSSWTKGHYVRFRPFWDEYRDNIKTVLVLMGFTMAYLFIIKSHFSRLWLFTVWMLVLLVLPITRILIRKLMISMGIWYTPTLYIADSFNVKNANMLEKDYYLGNKIIAVYITDGNHTAFNRNTKKSTYPMLSLDSEPAEILCQYNNPQIVVQMSIENQADQLKIIEKLAPLTNTLSIIPPMGEIPLYGADTYHVFSENIIVMRLKNNLSRRWSRLIKRLFDIVISGILLFMLSPLFMLLTLIIKKDGGGAFYGHQRVGHEGRLFKCYKFRSMAMNSETLLKQLLATDEQARVEWEKDFKLKNDPRITPLGKLIRKTSIDELPQLWNVMKGEMSLVGPRPIVEEELKRYGEKAPYYLGVRPGITGLWQVSGRNDVDYTRRVELDSWYVRNWALWYDLVILIKTIKVVFGKNGAY